MLTTIKGIYQNGQIVLEEKPTFDEDAEVLVTFTKIKNPEKKSRVFGSGKDLVIYMADDFNDPLDDLKEYM
ncbi:MAG: hypothetical protein ACKVOQ_12485 [Cyclobacteriaceae bacterium]|jgi:Protein of unknown function (DUF2281)